VAGDALTVDFLDPGTGGLLTTRAATVLSPYVLGGRPGGCLARHVPVTGAGVINRSLGASINAVMYHSGS
jgi:hypothetical protein